MPAVYLGPYDVDGCEYHLDAAHVQEVAEHDETRLKTLKEKTAPLFKQILALYDDAAKAVRDSQAKGWLEEAHLYITDGQHHVEVLLNKIEYALELDADSLPRAPLDYYHED